MALAELLARGFITCDSFAAVRQMITPRSRRRRALAPVGRWCCFRPGTVPFFGGHHRQMVAEKGDRPPSPASRTMPEEITEMIARQLLRRTGVVFRRILDREKIPVTWAALRRVYRRLELRGEIRGGRFVSGFSGEQFALPDALTQLRQLRRQGPREPVTVIPADPLNFDGILTPQETAASLAITSANETGGSNGTADAIAEMRHRIVG
jgi:ATP-dependent Lhr-like helicase